MRCVTWRVGNGPSSVRSRGGVGGSLPANGRGEPRPAASTSLSGERLRMKGSSVEVKIGVTDSPREISFNSAQTPTELEKLISEAIAEDSGVLSLTDEKGR